MSAIPVVPGTAGGGGLSQAEGQPILDMIRADLAAAAGQGGTPPALPAAPAPAGAPPASAEPATILPVVAPHGAQPAAAPAQPVVDLDAPFDLAGALDEVEGKKAAPTAAPAAAAVPAVVPPAAVAAPAPPAGAPAITITPESIAAGSGAFSEPESALLLAMIRRAGMTNALWQPFESEFAKSSRGKRQLASFQYTQALEKPEAEGGLGLIPPIDQVKSWQASAQVLSSLTDSFQNVRDLDSAAGFWTELFGSQPEGLEKAKLALEFLPQVLRGIELYKSMSATVMHNYLNQFLSTLVGISAKYPKGVDNSPERNERNSMTWALRSIFLSITGKDPGAETFESGLKALPMPGGEETEEVKSLRAKLAENERVKLADRAEQNRQIIVREMGNGRRKYVDAFCLPVAKAYAALGLSEESLDRVKADFASQAHNLAISGTIGKELGRQLDNLKKVDRLDAAIVNQLVVDPYVAAFQAAGHKIWREFTAKNLPKQFQGAVGATGAGTNGGAASGVPSSGTGPNGSQSPTAPAPIGVGTGAGLGASGAGVAGAGGQNGAPAGEFTADGGVVRKPGESHVEWVARDVAHRYANRPRQ